MLEASGDGVGPPPPMEAPHNLRNGLRAGSGIDYTLRDRLSRECTTRVRAKTIASTSPTTNPIT